ncbi:alkaline phosphatase family protein [bacterium]|nr:alkaline phosphatase family protein [bacterium]
MKRDRVLFLLIIIVVAAAIFVFLARQGGTSDERRVVAPGEDSLSFLVIGIEGLELSLIERFSEGGGLPHLSALMDDGAIGRFPSLERGINAEIPWTSLVTGMRPENQGIGGKRMSRRGELVDAPLSPEHRTVDTIWTILSATGGAPVGVIGWPGSWPVEDINGVMVGAHGRAILDRQHGGGAENRISPESQQQVLDAMYIDPLSVHRRDLGRFIDLETHNPYEALIGQNYVALANAYSGDESHMDVALSIIVDPGVESLLVCFLGLDGVSQRFWHYMDPESVLGGATLTDEGRADMLVQSETLGIVMERYYQYLDGIVGRLVSQAASDATIAVVTDHGYRGVELDWVGNPKIGHDMHSDGGLWIMKGPKVRPGARVDDGELFDFAATLMRAAGLEPTVEQDGRVLEEVLR